MACALLPSRPKPSPVCAGLADKLCHALVLCLNGWRTSAVSGLCIVSAGLAMVACGSSGTVQERRLGELHSGLRGLASTSDGRHIAYFAKGRVSGRWCVVLDGQEGPECNGAPCIHLTLSPDGKRVAYWGMRDERWRVVLDGQEGPESDMPVTEGEGEAERSLLFSPDGERVAYQAWRGGKAFVVVDGRDGPEYDGVIRGGPTFDPDGALEYLAARDKVLYRVRHPVP